MIYQLVRHDPWRACPPVLWRELQRWPQEVSRWFTEGFPWAPAVDVEETPDEVLVRAEVPGMSREAIRLLVHGQTLSISGERRQEGTANEAPSRLVERASGRFQRVVGLPAEVDGGRAKATYEQGVLTVRLPKAEQAKPKEIAIDER